MKKFMIVTTIIILMLAYTGCNENKTTSEANEVEQTNSEEELGFEVGNYVEIEGMGSVIIDIDLLNETESTSIHNIRTNPQEYADKVIRYRGTWATGNINGKETYLVVVGDSADCYEEHEHTEECEVKDSVLVTGLEVQFNGDKPANGTEVTVIGILRIETGDQGYLEIFVIE